VSCDVTARRCDGIGTVSIGIGVMHGSIGVTVGWIADLDPP
jgi:hypothetical protein